jgi:hypothetical protein
MQCDTPRIKRWEKPNLVRNVVEKTFEDNWKKGMIKWANNQVLTPSLTHDFKHIWCELEGRSERKLVKEWLCNLFKIFSLRRSTPLRANCSKREHML